MSNRPIDQQIKKAKSSLDNYSDEMRKVMKALLYQAAQEILSDVKNSRHGKGVPKDEGTLAASLRVTGVNQRRVDLKAGGAAAPYALVQHERLDYQHKLGEPRYLIRGAERWNTETSSAMNAFRENAKYAAMRAAGQG